MTQPTIEQMDVDEFINHLETTCVVLTDEPEVIPKFLAKPPRYYSFRVSEAEQMLEQFVSARIRAALTEKQGVALDEAPEAYYLQDSRSFVGNSMVWWGKGKSGYFCGLEDAHVFSKEDAFAQHKSRSTDIPWPKQYIDGLASRHVDIQKVSHKAALAAQREGMR